MRTTSGAKGVSKGGAERAALVLRAFASVHNEHWLFGIVKRLAEMLGHRQKALLCLPALRVFLCVRGPYYEYNGRGYAVLPGVDIRCHAC